VTMASWLVESWFQNSAIPNDTLLTITLQNTPIYQKGWQGSFAHNPPSDPFSRSHEAVSNLQDSIAALLHRGEKRLRENSLQLIKKVDPADLPVLLSATRAVFASFQAFWNQVCTSIQYGQEHVEKENVQRYMEYGLETNFWIKFRPYLQCRSTRRIGPEIGGAKSWCNSEYFQSATPQHFFSGGSGYDYVYESIIYTWVPNARIVTADCFMNQEEVARSTGWKEEKFIFKENCLTGDLRGDVPKGFDNKFVTFSQLLDDCKENYGIDSFNAIKVNIEASEYGMFGHIFHKNRSETLLKGTSHIHLEHHRMGMQRFGKSWASLLWSELLWATFMSGGFHPVSTEKWHDSTACQDVEFVNQTWYLEAEMSAVRDIMEYSGPISFVRYSEDIAQFECGEECQGFAATVSKSKK